MHDKHYEAKLEAQLSEWTARMESLMQRAVSAEAAERAAIEREIDQLDEKRKGVVRELEELRQVCAIETDEGVLAHLGSDEPVEGPFH